MGYKAKANAFLKSGFWMAGYGHFNVYDDEVVEIFKILEQPDPNQKLKDYYEKLSQRSL